MIKKNELEPTSFSAADDTAKKRLLVRKISDLRGQDEEGQGGAEGEIEFTYQDPTSGPSRDDLPVHEQKRLLKELQSNHEGLVKRQKVKREQRAAAKSGYHAGRNSRTEYIRGKEHPLSRTVQFGSGRDEQVNPDPNLFKAETNNEKQLQLRRSFDRQYQPENAPKATPKPQPR